MLSKVFTVGVAVLSAFAGFAVASPVKTDGTTDKAAADIKLAPRASGEFTWYNTGLGACGQVHNDHDLVAALSKHLFDPQTPGGNPNNNPLCNDRLRATYNGRSVEVTVVDRCEACAVNDIDLSPAAFQALADLGLGRIQGTWEWVAQA